MEPPAPVAEGAADEAGAAPDGAAGAAANSSPDAAATRDASLSVVADASPGAIRAAEVSAPPQHLDEVDVLVCPFGGRLNLRVRPDTTLSDMKTLLGQRTGIPPLNQRLLSGSPPNPISAAKGSILLSEVLGSSWSVRLADLGEISLQQVELGKMTLENFVAEVACKGVPDGWDELKDLALKAGIPHDDPTFLEWACDRQRSIQSVPVSTETCVATWRMFRLLLQSRDPRERIDLCLRCRPSAGGESAESEVVVEKGNIFTSLVAGIHRLTPQQLQSDVSVALRFQDSSEHCPEAFEGFGQELESQGQLWHRTDHDRSLRPAPDKESATLSFSSNMSSDEVYRACGRVFGLALVRGCKVGRFSQSFIEAVIGGDDDSEEGAPMYRVAARAVRSGISDVFGGLDDACPPLILLDAAELVEAWDAATLGPEDLAQWRSVARVDQAVTEQAEWLWEYLEEADGRARAQVLQFCTGSGHVSKVEQFVIEPSSEDDSRLPTAMICANLLMLPKYSCRKILVEQMQCAIQGCNMV